MIAGVADTHAAIWYLFADIRLSSIAHDFIEAAAKHGDQIAVSSITFIEIVYLIEKGRIPSETFTRLARSMEPQPTLLMEVPIDLNIARSMSHIDSFQVPDMPDRIIVATAHYFGVPLISRDRKIQLSGIETVW